MKNEFQKFAVGHKGLNSSILYDYTKSFNKNIGVLPMNMTPNVIEERQMNAISISVFDRLMLDRIIFIGLPIDDVVANIINAQLLFLESADPDKDTTIFFNSPGGSVYAGLGIYDLMQYVSTDIATVNMGMAASMASVLLCAGTKGKRSALKHSRTMIHQPSTGMEGTMSDLEISMTQGIKLKKELYEIISFHSGQSYEKIVKDSERDFWLSSEEAKEYGLIDTILLKKQ